MLSETEEGTQALAQALGLERGVPLAAIRYSEYRPKPSLDRPFYLITDGRTLALIEEYKPGSLPKTIYDVRKPGYPPTDVSRLPIVDLSKSGVHVTSQPSDQIKVTIAAVSPPIVPTPVPTPTPATPPAAGLEEVSLPRALEAVSRIEALVSQHPEVGRALNEKGITFRGVRESLETGQRETAQKQISEIQAALLGISVTEPERAALLTINNNLQAASNALTPPPAATPAAPSLAVAPVPAPSAAGLEERIEKPALWETMTVSDYITWLANRYVEVGKQEGARVLHIDIQHVVGYTIGLQDLRGDLSKDVAARLLESLEGRGIKPTELAKDRIVPRETKFDANARDQGDYAMEAFNGPRRSVFLEIVPLLPTPKTAETVGLEKQAIPIAAPAALQAIFLRTPTGAVEEIPIGPTHPLSADRAAGVIQQAAQQELVDLIRFAEPVDVEGETAPVEAPFVFDVSQLVQGPPGVIQEKLGRVSESSEAPYPGSVVLNRSVDAIGKRVLEVGWYTAPVSAAGLEEGVQVWTIDQLRERATGSIPIPPVGASHVALIVADAVERVAASVGQANVIIYSHPAVATGALQIVPDSWKMERGIQLLAQSPDLANEKLTEAAADVARGKTVLVAVDSNYLRGLRLPRTIAVLLNPATMDRLNLKVVAAYLSQPNLLLGYILDLSSGSVVQVQIGNRDFFALFISV